jgi:hypothetical protein
MPSPWEINRRIIREQYPGLAEELDRDDPGEAGEEPRIIPAASGDPTMILGAKHIHSPRDPAREGRRAAEALKGEGPLIVLGFGLGYAAEAAAEAGAKAAAENGGKNSPGRPLIIVERRRRVLRKALEARDLGDFLSTRRIIFILGRGDAGAAGDAVMGALGLLEKPGSAKTPELLRNRALMELDETWYAAVEGRIQTWISKDEVNMATLRRFGKRWIRNLAHNMESIRDLPGIIPLEGVLGGEIPVLLAAAGPSLDRILPLLPAMAERCLVAAVDTSLKALLKAGVNPDFVVAVDPQYWNSRHLDRAAVSKTRLIAESAVYPPVLRLPFKAVFLCGSLFPLGRFIEDRVDPKGRLGAGGSVATTAWDFARLLGASSIWIAGLDLAFPGLKTHFRGAFFEERALAEAARFDPAETRSVRALRDGRPFHALAAGGGQVLTDRRLSLYAAWFENRFRLFPGTPSRSLSPEGLAIPGMPAAGPEELLSLPPRRDEVEARLEGVFRGLEEGFYRTRADRALSYEGARRGLLAGLGHIKTLAEEAAVLAETGGDGQADRERVLARLDRVNQRIRDSEVKEVAGFLFPPAEELEADLDSPETEPYIRHLELSAKLYRTLAEAADYHLRVLGG